MPEELYDLQEKFLDEHDILIQTYIYMDAPEGISAEAEQYEALSRIDKHLETIGPILGKPKQINLIYDEPKGPDGLGFYDPLGGVIAFYIPGSMKNLQNIIDDAVDRKFFVARNFEEVVTHEFAHLKHHVNRPDLWPAMSDGKPPVKAKKMDEKATEISAFITDDISEYAASNSFEFVAEYTTKVLHQGKDTILSDELHDFFKEVT